MAYYAHENLEYKAMHDEALYKAMHDFDDNYDRPEDEALMYKAMHDFDDDQYKRMVIFGCDEDSDESSIRCSFCDSSYPCQCWYIWRDECNNINEEYDPEVSSLKETVASTLETSQRKTLKKRMSPVKPVTRGLQRLCKLARTSFKKRRRSDVKAMIRDQV